MNRVPKQVVEFKTNTPVITDLLQKCNGSIVYANGNMKESSRQHPITSSIPSLANTVFCKEPYSNNLRSFVPWLQYLRRGPGASDNPMPMAPIEIFGSGGAPEEGGAYAPDPNRADKPVFLTETPQDFFNNPANKSLYFLQRRKGVVALFVTVSLYRYILNHHCPDTVFTETEQSWNGDDDGVFLGYFSVSGFSTETWDHQQIVENLQGCQDTYDEKNYRFGRKGLVEHLVFKLEPIFSVEEHQQVQTPTCILEMERGRDYHLVKSYPEAELKEKIKSGDLFGDILDTTLESATLLKPFFSEDSQAILAQYDDDDEAQMNEHMVTQLHNLQRPTLDHVVEALALVSVAAAMRYLFMSLEPSEADDALFVGDRARRCKALEDRLNTFAVVPMASPSRILDPMPLVLHGIAVEEKIIGESSPRCTVSVDGENSELVETYLHRGMMLRLTGRTKPLKLNQELRQKDQPVSPTGGSQKKAVILPGPSEFDEWFLTCKKSADGLNRYTSGQHQKSIPHLFSTWDGMQQLAARLKEKGPDTAKFLCSTKSRLAAVLKVADLFRITGYDWVKEEEKLNFLGHQVLSDLEEIFIFPVMEFEAASVFPGFGGRFGYTLITGVSYKARNRKAYVGYLIERKDKLDQKLRNDEDFRKICGMRVTDDNRLVHALNDRPLQFTEVEHGDCKIAIAHCSTRSGRTVSSYPKLCRPHLHPIRLQKERLPWDDQKVRGIMEGIVKAWTTTAKFKTVPAFVTRFDSAINSLVDGHGELVVEHVEEV